MNADNASTTLNRYFSLFIIGCILANAPGLFNAILEPDGTLYASIAKHIVTSGDWLNLIGYGKDWLDKPHLPFWITAVSFKLFGFTSFAYKLPSFLCSLAGIYYTYLLALKIYGKTVAQLSAIIFATSLQFMFSNFDVRAEGYLTTFIIAATYHILRAADYRYSKHIVFAALFCAAAMMTKGVFVMITIAAGFVFYWMLTKQWKAFFSLKWYLLVVLSFIFILPELYSLYMQFDLHPEKIVYDKTGVSGIRFFFWDSQFGRFFNNGPIKGSGNPFFFFHTILWAFLPMSLFLYFAVFNLFRKKKPRNNKTLIISFSALISFILFSLSRFQLPYYVLIIFPHFSMITASWIEERQLKNQRFINITLTVLFFMLMVLSLSLLITLGTAHLMIYIILMVIAAALFFSIKKEALATIAAKCICFSLLLSIFLNLFLYPYLFKYQTGMLAAQWMNAHQPKIKQVTMYRSKEHTSFIFYADAEVKFADTLHHSANTSAPKFVIYGRKEFIDSLTQSGFKVSALQRFQYFHISKMNINFIRSSKRKNQLQTFELAEIN